MSNDNLSGNPDIDNEPFKKLYKELIEEPSEGEVFKLTDKAFVINPKTANNMDHNTITITRDAIKRCTQIEYMNVIYELTDQEIVSDTELKDVIVEYSNGEIDSLVFISYIKKYAKKNGKFRKVKRYNSNKKQAIDIEKSKRDAYINCFRDLIIDIATTLTARECDLKAKKEGKSHTEKAFLSERLAEILCTKILIARVVDDLMLTKFGLAHSSDNYVKDIQDALKNAGIFDPFKSNKKKQAV